MQWRWSGREDRAANATLVFHLRRATDHHELEVVPGLQIVVVRGEIILQLSANVDEHLRLAGNASEHGDLLLQPAQRHVGRHADVEAAALGPDLAHDEGELRAFDAHAAEASRQLRIPLQEVRGHGGGEGSGQVQDDVVRNAATAQSEAIRQRPAREKQPLIPCKNTCHVLDSVLELEDTIRTPSRQLDVIDGRRARATVQAMDRDLDGLWSVAVALQTLDVQALPTLDAVADQGFAVLQDLTAPRQLHVRRGNAHDARDDLLHQVHLLSEVDGGRHSDLAACDRVQEEQLKGRLLFSHGGAAILRATLPVEKCARVPHRGASSANGGAALASDGARSAVAGQRAEAAVVGRAPGGAEQVAGCDAIARQRPGALEGHTLPKELHLGRWHADLTGDELLDDGHRLGHRESVARKAGLLASLAIQHREADRKFGSGQLRQPLHASSTTADALHFGQRAAEHVHAPRGIRCPGLHIRPRGGSGGGLGAVLLAPGAGRRGGEAHFAFAECARHGHHSGTPSPRP
mmetsp:Transcript_27032/g.89747  ORF Transcript_27032/g.89747 Transcript_27032/m.89747 type:complete len:520 (+) Transcript_27032:1125-2684(+)